LALYVCLSAGWRPRRTIIFCSWGAEEYGITGTYEWVEVGVHCFQTTLQYRAKLADIKLLCFVQMSTLRSALHTVLYLTGEVSGV